MTAFTHDSFFENQLFIRQNKNGYRFSIDPVLLAHHIHPKPCDRILDLGTGSAILPLLIATLHPDTSLVAVELQSSLHEVAAENIRANHLEERIRLIKGDMQGLTQETLSGPVDAIVINPPYRKLSSGRINPQSERAIARHEIHIDLAGWIRTAKKLLRTGGRLSVIFPAQRAAELMNALSTAGIPPKGLRTIHSHAGETARLVIVDAVARGQHGLTIHPPLIVYKEGQTYSDEVSAMFRLPA